MGFEAAHSATASVIWSLMNEPEKARRPFKQHAVDRTEEDTGLGPMNTEKMSGRSMMGAEEW
jgi:hypothetical protein